MNDPQVRIKITLQLWRSGAQPQFEDYIRRLLELLPRHRGILERRINEIETGLNKPDTMLVLSFPDGAAVEGYLRDPLRNDLDKIAVRVLTRSLITDARSHDVQEHDPVDVIPLPLSQPKTEPQTFYPSSISPPTTT